MEKNLAFLAVLVFGFVLFSGCTNQEQTEDEANQYEEIELSDEDLSLGGEVFFDSSEDEFDTQDLGIDYDFE